MQNITLKNLKKYHENYQKNKQNKIIENAIVQNGIDNVCLNHKRKEELNDVFSFELPKSKPYDQERSLRCWSFSVINMLKYNIASNMNIDVKELDLSLNYLNFFDKLEKCNSIYENIINSNNLDYFYLYEESITSFFETGWDLGG